MHSVARFLLFNLLLLLLAACQNEQFSAQIAQANVARWSRQPAAEVQRQLFPNQDVRYPAQPLRLQIPTLRVDAPIEAVGRTPSGAMQTPTVPQEAAWYQPGALPGAPGNAVIAGHLNQPGGKPAIFWDLKKLQVGDEVRVVDEANVTWKFRVERLVSYPYTEAPLEEIFTFQPGRRLNLITCTGEWDKKERTYDQRLVVYTTFDSFSVE